MRRAYLLSCSLCASQAAACAAGDAASDFENPSLEWCGDKPCVWELDQGPLARVSTWHVRDHAVSFEDTGAQISQRIGSRSETCYLVDTIADVETAARLSILADFNDDQVIDFTQQVTPVRWRSVQFEVPAPVSYASLRLIVRKEGTGRAVLALLRVVPQSECAGPPLTLADGSSCSQNEVCKSGSCVEQRCQPCSDAACSSLAPAARSE